MLVQVVPVVFFCALVREPGFHAQQRRLPPFRGLLVSRKHRPRSAEVVAIDQRLGAVLDLLLVDSDVDVWVDQLQLLEDLSQAQLYTHVRASPPRLLPSLVSGFLHEELLLLNENLVESEDAVLMVRPVLPRPAKAACLASGGVLGVKDELKSL